MTKIKDFYRKQLLWSQQFIDVDMTILYDDLVEKVAKHLSGASGKILELGAGNGQFAVAAAKAGFDITVIELVPECVQQIRHLQQIHDVQDGLTIIEGDFYTVPLDDRFDVICYWDGFGVGSDEDQQKLLTRMNNWLVPNGCAFIDIYTPWYWAKTAGQKMKVQEIERVYEFEPFACRMLDTWWVASNPTEKITQSLRCYSPADLELLLPTKQLQLELIETGGSMDYENWVYEAQVPLEQAMMYMAKLRKT